MLKVRWACLHAPSFFFCIGFTCSVQLLVDAVLLESYDVCFPSIQLGLLGAHRRYINRLYHQMVAVPVHLPLFVLFWPGLGLNATMCDVSSGVASLTQAEPCASSFAAVMCPGLLFSAECLPAGAKLPSLH